MDFRNKISLAVAQANEAEMDPNQKGGKGAGKLFWNLASGLRKMVTKRFTKSESAAMEFDNGRNAMQTPQKAGLGVNFEEVINQN